jgi:hypothetical protein
MQESSQQPELRALLASAERMLDTWSGRIAENTIDEHYIALRNDYNRLYQAINPTRAGGSSEPAMSSDEMRSQLTQLHETLNREMLRIVIGLVVNIESLLDERIVDDQRRAEINQQLDGIRNRKGLEFEIRSQSPHSVLQTLERLKKELQLTFNKETIERGKMGFFSSIIGLFTRFSTKSTSTVSESIMPFYNRDQRMQELVNEYKKLRELYSGGKFTEAVDALVLLCKKIEKSEGMALGEILPQIIEKSEPSDLEPKLSKGLLSIYKDKPEESANFDFYLFSLEAAIESAMKSPAVVNQAGKKAAEIVPDYKVLLGDSGELRGESLRAYLANFNSPIDQLNQLKEMFDYLYDNKDKPYSSTFLPGLSRLQYSHIKILQHEALRIVNDHRADEKVKSFIIDADQNGSLFDYTPSRFNFNPLANARKSAMATYRDDPDMVLKQVFASAAGRNPFKAKGLLDSIRIRLFNPYIQVQSMKMSAIVDYLIKSNNIQHAQFLFEEGASVNGRNFRKEFAGKENALAIQRMINQGSPELLRMVSQAGLLEEGASEKGQYNPNKKNLEDRLKNYNKMEKAMVFISKLVLSDPAKLAMNTVLSRDSKGNIPFGLDKVISKSDLMKKMKNLLYKNPSLVDEFVNILINNMRVELKQKMEKFSLYERNVPRMIENIDRAIQSGDFNPGAIHVLPEKTEIHVYLKGVEDALKESKNIKKVITGATYSDSLDEASQLVELLNKANDANSRLEKSYNNLTKIDADIHKPYKVVMKSKHRGTPSQPDAPQTRDNQGGPEPFISTQQLTKDDVLEIRNRDAGERISPLSSRDLEQLDFNEELKSLILKRASQLRDKISQKTGENTLEKKNIDQKIMSELKRINMTEKPLADRIPQMVNDMFDRYEKQIGERAQLNAGKNRGIIKRSDSLLRVNVEKLSGRELSQFIRNVNACLKELQQGRFLERDEVAKTENLPDLSRSKQGPINIELSAELETFLSNTLTAKLEALKMAAESKLAEVDLLVSEPNPEFKEMLKRAEKGLGEEAKTEPPQWSRKSVSAQAVNSNQNSQLTDQDKKKGSNLDDSASEGPKLQEK